MPRPAGDGPWPEPCRLAPGWQPPPDRLALPPAEVHAWLFSLDPGEGQAAELAGLLAADERARAGRFYFERDRRRFAVARGRLRKILGGYLDQRAQALGFVYGRQGKPDLAAPHDQSGLRFNLSHSGELGLLVVARGREVGADIEQQRPMADMAQVAERFFSPREVAVFRRVADKAKQQAFLNCWTRKEAYIKAIGEGLSRPLDSFDVSLAPGEPARLLYVAGRVGEVARWRLESLETLPGYAAALAAEGQDWRLVQYVVGLEGT
jgi:4'-phosphopantetheinyl transferase